MENKYLGLVILVAAVIVAGSGFLAKSDVVVNVPGQLGGASGPTYLVRQDFIAGAVFGAETNVAVTARNCVSLSNYNPPSLSSSGVPTLNTTSTGFTVTGAAITDLCQANLSSATSTQAYTISCTFPTAASTSVTFANLTSAAIDVVTGTLKVCYTN